jgi:antitoxin (DNA-binding transcriptional repressor) of toxin-antitoxin stability system
MKIIIAITYYIAEGNIIMEITVQAGKFKDKCLKLLNDVQRGDTCLITKRGVPFARLSALEPKIVKLF